MSCDVFGIVGCASLCIPCFSHSPHVYLIHIKRAYIKANNLNKVSTHRNVSLEMTAPPHQAGNRGAILSYYCYVFICLSRSLQLPVCIVFHLFTSQLLLPLPVSMWLRLSVCSAHQSRQDSVPMVRHEYFTTLLRNLCPGIGVESSHSASSHHWFLRSVCSHQLGLYTAV